MKWALWLGLAACGARSTPAPASPSCRGDHQVSSQEDLDAVAACGAIDGSVTIRTAAALDLSGLVALREVSGDVVVGPTFDLDVVHLEGLRKVGGALRVVSNGVATGAFLPALEEAGSVEVGGNVGLGGFAAPLLHRVGGDLIVEENPDLELLDLAMLAEVGGTLRIDANPILALIEMNALARIGGAEVTGAQLPDGFVDVVRAAVRPVAAQD
jgi:hypothetical protein